MPTDFSECALHAFPYAEMLARQFGASIVLLHAVQFKEVEYASLRLGPLLHERLALELVRSSKQQLAGMARDAFNNEIPVRKHVQIGSPAPLILEAARQFKADMIVMATHGYSGFKHALLGSTTEQVVRHAPCPVLTVRVPSEKLKG